MAFESSKSFEINKSSEQTRLAATAQYFCDATDDGGNNQMDEVERTRKKES